MKFKEMMNEELINESPEEKRLKEVKSVLKDLSAEATQTVSYMLSKNKTNIDFEGYDKQGLYRLANILVVAFLEKSLDDFSKISSEYRQDIDKFKKLFKK